MGRLEVRLCAARNIGDTQKVGIPDPYVKILMGDRKKTQIKYKTKIMKDNLNPVWNEVAKFQIADYDSTQIVFEVWNDNVMVDNVLGTYAFSVNALQRGVVRDIWGILVGARLSCAEIHLQLLAVDFGVDPPPGARIYSCIEEYMCPTPTPNPAASGVKSEIGCGYVSSSMDGSESYDSVKKPDAPAMGIPLQGGYVPQQPQQPVVYYQQGSPLPPQQQVQYVQQPPVQYVQQQPYAVPYPPPPQQPYGQPQPYPPQSYAQPQPYPPQSYAQPAYYQQGPPPPQPGGYYPPGPPQPPQPGYYGQPGY